MDKTIVSEVGYIVLLLYFIREESGEYFYLLVNSIGLLKEQSLISVVLYLAPL